MRTLTAISVVVVTAGCSREQPTPAKHHEVEPPTVASQPPPTAKEDPCPKSAVASAANAPVVIADQVHVIRSQMPLRWVAADQHLYELAADPRKPQDLGPVDNFKSPVWDDKYWYRSKCYENCDDRTSMGIPHAVERVDRVTGESKRLGKGDYGLGKITLFGDYVYWGVYGHQSGGGVSRVSKEGGEQEDIRIAADADHEDKVKELTAYTDGILVQGRRTLAWIPANGERPRVVLRVGESMGPAILDGDSFYVAEEGERYWQSKDSGYIHRVSVAEGKDTKLAGPVRWPSAIATFGTNVYFMLRESGDIWSVPKQGGEPTQVLKNGPRIQPCDESQALWADERGLFWLRGKDDLFGQIDSRLYFQPWPATQKVDAASETPKSTKAKAPGKTGSGSR